MSPETESKIGAACVVVEGEDELVLAVSRKDNPRDFGLPGGKMEPRESPEDCARRELKEETGVSSETLIPVFIGPARTPGRLSQAFLSVLHFNEPRLRERGAIGWVSWEVLFEGSFGAYNRDLKAALDALPLCSSFSRGSRVCYVDSAGFLRRGKIDRVTRSRVYVMLIDDCPGLCWFSAGVDLEKLVEDVEP